MGWLGFAAAWVAFFVTHSIPLRPAVRPRLVAALGRRGFAAAYSVLSLGVLAWLLAAAGWAPYVPLWTWEPWQSMATLTLMLVACLIAAFALGAPNPLSFGGMGNDRFDPAAPGLVRYLRHPLLAVLGLWASAHILPNGDLAYFLTFGSFAAFAVLGTRIVDRRRRRALGSEWQRLTAAVRAAPLLARPARPLTFALRLAAGILLYVALLYLHPIVIGVDPMAF